MWLEYTNKTPEATFADIQILLKNYKVTKMMLNYDSYGEMQGFAFSVNVDGQELPFKMPVDHKAIWEAAKRGEAKNIKNEEQARKIAWRQTFRWIEAQCRFIKGRRVKLEQVFLAYLMIDQKNTLYDKMLEDKFLYKQLPMSSIKTYEVETIDE